MHVISSPLLRRRRVRFLACVGTAALAVAPLAVLPGAASAAATPVIRSANLPNFPGVLENHASRTLYLLSTEKGAKLHCTSKACLSLWLPLAVPAATKSVVVASTVKGKVGFVARSKTSKQVTVNTYPVYTFKGDSGPNQSNGEAVVADGGTWLMLHAGAKTPASTSVAPLLQSGNASPYTGVLANSRRFTLYVLTNEKGGTLHCVASCLSIWPPLLVTSGTTSISVGPGVKGTVGFVTRGSSKQVTFNSYPVYTYSGDSAAQSNGEGIKADGGTWYIASAAATTAATTPVPTK